jgi:arabinose-5-phosphate isomerase
LRPPSTHLHHRWGSEEAAAIDAASNSLDSQQVDAALSILDACRNRRAKLVITGIGKLD